ncbi:MAG: NAD(P)/FAD-dependent oxidoreductase [Candidatus Doudnabacteria bacterium]
MQNQKTIVILGGGFGGVNVAVGLSKKVSVEEAKIILVDQQDYHLYHPNLYEIASFEEEFASIEDLKKSTALPFSEILPSSVQFIQGVAESISQKNKTVTVSGKTISFDYLVVALGSTADYFGIPGVAENARSMKSLGDVLRLKNDIEFLVQSHRQNSIKKYLRIVVAGGGYTGVELAGEMTNLLSIVAWKNNYPLDRIQVEIIEGSSQLMLGMPSVVSSAAYYRLKSIGVNVLLNSIISAVNTKQISLSNGETINYDLLTWTGGVKSVDIPFDGETKKDKKHRCMTESDLTLTGFSNIYMIGDNACVMDAKNIPLPQTATQAILHAEYVVKALNAKLKNKKTPRFVAQSSPYIVPIKGKWAIMHLTNGFTMTGFLPWLIKIFANIRYYNRFMSLDKAINLAWFDTKLFIKND